MATPSLRYFPAAVMTSVHLVPAVRTNNRNSQAENARRAVDFLLGVFLIFQEMGFFICFRWDDGRIEVIAKIAAVIDNPHQPRLVPPINTRYILGFLIVQLFRYV